jgi:soluble lytic murein transglycosylase-like protein
MRSCILIAAVAAVAMTVRAESAAIKAQKASVAKQRAAVKRQAAVTKASSVATAWAAPWTPRPVAESGCEPVAAPELARIVATASEASSIAPGIVREVARQESEFLPCAVSSKGAEGLMQLMPATQLLLGVGDPFDAEENVMAGARLLKELLDRYHGDLSLALSAYNAGPRRVDEADGIPPIAETRAYVAKILGRLKE